MRVFPVITSYSIHYTKLYESVQLDQMHLVVRELPTADVNVAVTGGIVVPAQAGVELQATAVVDGFIGELPVQATAALRGDRVRGSAHVPRSGAGVVKSAVPGISYNFV